ncbi:MAG: AMP-binding protein [Gammaproteobacteria bacterium]|nr:AMP-binding protein [Gammaproteobacteria bacterium]MDH5800330.1 AMP-binding protein [Gammaproteobacteria bacterium]
MDNSDFPLLSHTAAQTVARFGNTDISRDHFLADVYHVAQALPDHSYAINLCENRYHFLVAFTAALVKGQTNLLPASHAQKTILDVAQQYPNSYCLTDHRIDGIELPEFFLQLPQNLTITDGAEVPHIASDHLACIAFTSGSTGQSTPNAKTWGQLVRVTRLIQQSFGIQTLHPLTLIATVPPQHMYGLETSIMLPLVSGSCVFAGRPFYPQDIRNALLNQDGPKVLITTPTHLRVCVESGLSWPAPEFIISATAPLPQELALKAEQVFGAPVKEIYGCTECGSMASRRTVEGNIWKLFDTLRISNQDGDSIATAPYLDQAVVLGDIVICHDENRFELAGRKSDMLNIAGKRASLADLNHKLLAIEGIEDGVLFLPDCAETDTLTRLVAFVVAPALQEKQILDALRLHVDGAFLPRPIYKVEQLPREKTGKLPRKNLLSLLDQLRVGSTAHSAT